MTAIQDIVARSRKEQGLPRRVHDPRTLAQVAALLLPRGPGNAERAGTPAPPDTIDSIPRQKEEIYVQCRTAS